MQQVTWYSLRFNLVWRIRTPAVCSIEYIYSLDGNPRDLVALHRLIPVISFSFPRHSFLLFLYFRYSSKYNSETNLRVNKYQGMKEQPNDPADTRARLVCGKCWTTWHRWDFPMQWLSQAQLLFCTLLHSYCSPMRLYLKYKGRSQLLLNTFPRMRHEHSATQQA